MSEIKGCGIYLFDKNIFKAIKKTQRSPLRGEYEITDSIQLLINWGYKVLASEVIKHDINITNAKDLLICNLLYLKSARKKNQVHRSSRIHPEAKFVNSVINKEVIIENPITIKNSLLLPGAKISDNQNITNSIVSHNFFLSFKNIN